MLHHAHNAQGHKLFYLYSPLRRKKTDTSSLRGVSGKVCLDYTWHLFTQWILNGAWTQLRDTAIAGAMHSTFNGAHLINTFMILVIFLEIRDNYTNINK
jgi:hypothetical protein